MTSRATHGRDGVLVVGQGPPARGGIPSFISMLLEDPALTERIQLTALNTSRAPARPGAATPANAWSTLRDLVRVFLGGRRVRIVHLHVAPAPLLPLVRASALAVAGRISGAKVIVHAHSGRMHIAAASSRSYRAGLRSLVRIAHRIVVVSSDGAGALRRAGGHPITLPNAVDIGPSDPPSRPGSRIVIFVGTVCERKGLDDLRLALVSLRDAGEEAAMPAEVVIVGDGRQEGPGAFDRIRAAYAASGLLDLVRFTGALPPAGVRSELTRASVFCLPSHWEGSPISMLEAMAAGCAIIATRVGEIPSVLEEAGIVIEPHDPAALAGAIGGLMADPARKEALGAHARQRVVKSFSLDTMRERLLEIYADLGYSR
ncbi:MAG: glycosyltransferase family 4 protein [Actinomycetota bacterium]